MGMSEQEIKEQIREQIDESARTRIIDGDLSDLSPFDTAVELSISQDKIATNRTVDAVLELIDAKVEHLMHQYKMQSAGALQKFRSEIEKLRRV